eukprot:NODE_7634_length_457_cov_230.384804_g7183_i0.p1 GENE.NODE_7634_length_457_cov_230.384804_g7183_i0~~NODE_7634_length_457_cov_230.384804_g7183_i0.p1  ORF type:complete len:130 (+),score=39.09 NODE_7634_length_457_cov_230.384804_g7183_i0:51-392(+)
MTKGTTSFGRRNGHSHTLCKRCGRKAFHIQKHACASCGYPSPKMRRYNWSQKAKRRQKIGTGRMRHMKKFLLLAKRRQNEDAAGPHKKVKTKFNRGALKKARKEKLAAEAKSQ